MTLSTGDDAPPIAAESQDGETVSPSFEEPTVVYFYPRDDTPGCTMEAREFNEAIERYRDEGVAVYGVSTDDVESHRSFADDCGLEFDLLADPDGEVARAFDVAVDGGAASRTTFVLADGEVKAVYRNVDPDGHARSVLEDMRNAGLVVG